MTLPRVTEILQGAGLIDTTWFTDEGCLRGTAVHAACHYLDEGDLDEDSLDPALRGYVEAYKKYWQDIGPLGNGVGNPHKWEWIECPKQDPLGLYRGTPDRIAVVRPRELWDIKTGGALRWHPIQLAAYVNMLDDPYAYRRFGVYLKADGSYSVHEYPRTDYQRDLAVFMAALTLYNWRHRNGN